jgi:hypothetical protein
MIFLVGKDRGSKGTMRDGGEMLLAESGTWRRAARMRGVALGLAGAILPSTPAAVQPLGSQITARFTTSFHSPASRGAILPAPVEPLGATTSRPPPAQSRSFPGDLGGNAQKRINIRPFLSWIWLNARHLWNGLVDAVRWGWFTFSGYWWNLPGWVRGAAIWFTGGTVWDIYVSLRGYFFGW